MDKYGSHITRMRQQGVLWKAYALMSAHDGWGVDGLRTASKLRVAGESGELTELHVNAVKPVITNVLSLICGQRPAVKPVAVNGDSESSAQTRLAMQLHEAYDRKTSSAELETETVRGALLSSQWWVVQEWASGEGEVVYARDPEDPSSLVYEGDVRQFTLPPWHVAADMVASNADERRWVLFCRQYNRFELAQRVTDPYVQDKLRNYKPKDSISLLQGEAAISWSDVEALDRLRGDFVDEDDGVIVWELRHLPSPACPEGRLVKWISTDCVLWDSRRVVVDGEEKAVRYPYDAKELHAYDFVPERKPGTTVGHSAMFDLTALQQFVDLCTTSMATTVDKMGVSNLWAAEEPQAAKKIGKYGGIRVLRGTGAPPVVLDFPALKPEVVQALDWAQSQMAQTGALNDVVMGAPPKGMPASAQALQRAQAVQYHEVSQRNYVRLVSRIANGRLRLLKRFALTERVSQLAGKQGEYESKAWSAPDIAAVERFDVEPVNPMSQTFEGRQNILDMMQPGEVDAMGRLDFLQTGSLPKALMASTARDELIDRHVSLLEQGVGLPPVTAASMQALDEYTQAKAAGAPVGPPPPPEFEAEGTHVRVLKSDPHHLAIPRYLAVLNSAEAKTDARAVAALGVVNESYRLWLSCTPDECVAFGLPFLPSHQSALAAPPMPPVVPGEPPPGEPPPAEAPAPPGDEGAVNLPSPPPSPLTGEETPADDLELPNA